MSLSSDADSLAYIRAATGDNDLNDQYNTDAELDYLYREKASSDLDKTIVWALRYMKAKAFRKVAFTNNATGDTNQAQQEWEHISAMLAYWENLIDLGSTLTAGSFGLELDFNEDDIGL